SRSRTTTERWSPGAFRDRSELEQALAAQIDEILVESKSHHWYSALVNAPGLHRSVVVRDLLRRADAAYGSSPRIALDLTRAAVTICDAMRAGGEPPSADLYFQALKEHAIALHR